MIDTVSKQPRTDKSMVSPGRELSVIMDLGKDYYQLNQRAELENTTSAKYEHRKRLLQILLYLKWSRKDRRTPTKEKGGRQVSRDAMHDLGTD